MRYLLDTNILIEAAGNTSLAIAALKQAVASDWVGYSAITRLELFGYRLEIDQSTKEGWI